MGHLLISEQVDPCLNEPFHENIVPIIHGIDERITLVLYGIVRE